MTSLRPVAIVIDRATAASVADSIESMGGAWWDMFQLWQRADVPYLVMLAHTNKRIRHRAPLTWIVIDEHALRATMQTACERLTNVQCQWLLCVQPGSDGDAIVREMLLLDAAVEGRA
jgi:hypothetical protein